MKHQGPALEVLLHRLSNCPTELVEHASQSPARVTALVCDYFRLHDPTIEAASILKVLKETPAKYGQWMPLVVWLISHSWFLSRSDLAESLLKLFNNQRLIALSSMFKLEQLAGDPDRREELVRIVLMALDLRPDGETLEQAQDRLTTLDSVERTRILKATLAAEQRAKEVREAMARARAQEASSRYGE